jgi:tetratricopeptide (TPR) repeat protein
MELTMKAEHRHELKTNELAQWLINLPVWARQNFRIIIYIAVVVVLVAGSYLYRRYQKTVVTSREEAAMTILLSQLPQQEIRVVQAQAQGVDNSYVLLQMADQLDAVANGAKQDGVAAMSLIKEAEILRTELQLRLGNTSREDVANQIARAKEKYNKALDTYLKRSPNFPVEALAKLGLGLCEEELGNLDQARTIYNEVATGADFAVTTSAAAAKRRLALMDSFNQKIVLKPEPKSLLPAQPPAEPGAEIPTINFSPESQVQITPGVNVPGLK